jgi:hypothetical protein
MRRSTALALSALGLAPLALPADACALKFGTSPSLPALPNVTLNAKPQTTNAKMNNFSVQESALEKEGWNVTVAGQSGTGKSAVFKQYCPSAKCGTDPEGYVSGGQTLPATSLTLNTTGASFTGGSGATPAFQCSSGCSVDSASAVKIASKAEGLTALGGTWTTTGFSSTSLALSTATTLKVLPASEEYRVNILWTLSTGP